MGTRLQALCALGAACLLASCGPAPAPDATLNLSRSADAAAEPLPAMPLVPDVEADSIPMMNGVPLVPLTRR